MTCQTCFLRKIRKAIKMSSADFLPKVLNVKHKMPRSLSLFAWDLNDKRM